VKITRCARHLSPADADNNTLCYIAPQPVCSSRAPAHELQMCADSFTMISCLSHIDPRVTRWHRLGLELGLGSAHSTNQGSNWGQRVTIFSRAGETHTPAGDGAVLRSQE